MLRKTVLLSLSLVLASLSMSMTVPASAQTKTPPAVAPNVSRTATASAKAAAATATTQTKATAAAATANARAASATAKVMSRNATATAVVRSRAATAAAAAATATAKAVSRNATAEAKVTSAAATAEVRAAIATGTAEARDAEIREFAQYLPIDLKPLLDYPDVYAGELVVLSGRVFNIVPGSNEVFQMFAAGTYDALLIETRDSFVDLYENDTVTVYGEVEGEECFDNSMGNEICQPKITKAMVFKQQTQTMRVARSTAVAEAAEIKRGRIAAEATDAAAARATASAQAAEYTRIADRELSTYPEAHTGEKVRVRARVFNVVEDSAVIQANLAGNGEPIYIDAAKAFYGIYEGDVIEVFGEVEGVKCFTNRAGGEVCHPHLIEALIVK